MLLQPSRADDLANRWQRTAAPALPPKRTREAEHCCSQSLDKMVSPQAASLPQMLLSATLLDLPDAKDDPRQNYTGRT